MLLILITIYKPVIQHSKIAVDSNGNIFLQSLNTAGYAEFSFGNITKSAMERMVLFSKN